MKKKMVTIYDDEGRAGTVLIAEGFGRRHEQITRLIRKYQDKFESLNTLKVFKARTKGRSYNEYLLDGDQFIFLGTLFKNNDQIVEFKLRLVKEFKLCRNRLARAVAQNKEPEWIQGRVLSKTLRRLETEVIKEFIEYAKLQGGTPDGCDRYYANFTKMTNVLLFICEGKFKNLRNILTGQQLMTVGAADLIINKSVKDDMAAGVFYKTIYQNAKDKVKIFADLHGQSEVLAQQMIED